MINDNFSGFDKEAIHGRRREKKVLFAGGGVLETMFQSCSEEEVYTGGDVYSME